MDDERNELGQRIGRRVAPWQAPPRPERTELIGRHCRLEPLTVGSHAEALYEANGIDAVGRMWTYLPYGPFRDFTEYRLWVEGVERSTDPMFLAIIDARSGRAAGVASYLRIDPPNGSIEVGHLAFSPRLQRTIAATEAMFLMMDWAFSAGYRRYEWKCNALNESSRRAATRLGLSYEGVFRQAKVVKGRNRDTAWYAAIDTDWPAIKQAFQRWLDPGNFDATGRQQVSLRSLTFPSSTFVATDGEGYEQQMGRWSRRLAESFLDFSGCADGERVLDVGCGTGNLAHAVAARANISSICGIDYSAAYVDHAQRHNRDPRIEFRTGDACQIAFADSTYDRVLSLLVLQFIPQAERAVAEMRRVARPGAIVGAAVWDARGGFVANRLFFDTAAMLHATGAERRARNFTRPMSRPGELAMAWQDAGFSDVRETTLTIRMEFESFDDYWNPMTGTNGATAEYVNTLDSTERARLRDAVRLAYLDGEPDGARSYAATAWAVKGTKPL